MKKAQTIQQFAEENPDKVHVVDSEKLKKANENIKIAIKGKTKKRVILTGWVTRDLGNEAELNLFTEKPIRGEFNWFVSNGDIIRLKNIFPELKWEDTPMEVEITIKHC